MRLPRFHPAVWIALVCFALMALGAYLRLFVSVGFLGYMDEQYWVAAAALSSLGGLPYYNDLHIQQNCALLYEPFVWLYYKIVGSTGVLLFVRHLYFILAAASAALYFKYFRPRTDLATSLAIVLLLMIATWWAQPSLGYNSIGGLCFGCGSLLAIRGLDERQWKHLFGSGILFAIALGAYPTLLGAVICLWLILAGFCIYLKIPWLKQMLFANGVTVVFLGGFLLSIVLRTSVDDVFMVYKFSTAHSSLGSFSWKVTYGLWLWYKFLPPWWILAPYFVLWVVLWKKHDVPWQFFAIPFAIYMAIKDPPESGTFFPPMSMLLVVSGIPLLVQAWREGLRENWKYIALWGGGFAGTAFTCWSSALTIYVTFVTSNFCLIVVMFLASRSRRFTPWVSASTMILMAIIFFHRYGLNQLDDHEVTYETEMMMSGPYAGLLTSPERATFLKQLEADIETGTKNAKTILFYDEFPMGYLMTPLFPATRTLWSHTLRESFNVKGFIREYYYDAKNRPDVIFRFNYFSDNGRKVPVTPEQFKPYEDVFWDYLPKEAEYGEVIRRDSYSVFKKKSLDAR